MNRQVYSELMQVKYPDGESHGCKLDSFTVSKKDAEMERVRAMFGNGRGVPEGTYMRMSVRGTLMMTDTPDELRDHREPFYQAKGICLVTGLGLGCVVQGMLERRDREGVLAVQKVIVIEKEAGVIELVGKPLKERYGDRLEIRHADALTYKAPKGERYNVVWHDIWPDICEDNLDTMATLHRKYGRRCDWQGSWQRHQLKALRRESRSRERAYRW